MHSWLPRLPVWIIEGAAEYLTAGRYAPGRLSLRAYGKNLEQNGAGGREVRTTDLGTLMAMDHPTWIGELAKGGAERNYRSAMLLFYYFCHEDGDQTGQHLIDYFQSRKVSRGPTRRIAKNTCSGAGMRRPCGRTSNAGSPPWGSGWIDQSERRGQAPADRRRFRWTLAADFMRVRT